MPDLTSPGFIDTGLSLVGGIPAHLFIVIALLLLGILACAAMQALDGLQRLHTTTSLSNRPRSTEAEDDWD